MATNSEQGSLVGHRVYPFWGATWDTFKIVGQFMGNVEDKHQGVEIYQVNAPVGDTSHLLAVLPVTTRSFMDMFLTGQINQTEFEQRADGFKAKINETNIGWLPPVVLKVLITDNFDIPTMALCLEFTGIELNELLLKDYGGDFFNQLTQFQQSLEPKPEYVFGPIKVFERFARSGWNFVKFNSKVAENLADGLINPIKWAAIFLKRQS